MASKEQFLRNLRAAMDRGYRPVPEAPSHPPLRPRPDELVARAQAVRRQAAERRTEAVATLLRMASLQAWNVVRVSSRSEAAEAIAGIAAGLGAKLAVRSNHPVLDGMPLDAALAARGVEVRLIASDGTPQMSPRVLREVAARADVGITGVDFMVAETATAVLLSRKGRARVTSLLPPVHVAVVEAEQVVPTLADALALCQEQLIANGWTSHSINLVSGPSRTGDIEQTIVVGVHGPREVHLVLIG